MINTRFNAMNVTPHNPDHQPTGLQSGSTIVPKPINLMASVRNHLVGALLMTSLCLFAGGGYVFFKITPEYYAEAKIMIEPVIPKILYGKEEASITPYYDDFVRTQINIIKGFSVLSQAIANYENMGFQWRLRKETMQTAVDRLMKRLTAKQLRGTHLISISLEDSKARGLAELVNSVVETYTKTIRVSQFSNDSSRKLFLKKKKDALEKELDAKYEALANFAERQALGATSERNIYVYLQAVVDIQQSMVKARAHETEVESTLRELLKERERLKAFDISTDIEEWVEKDNTIEDNRIQMSRKLQNMRITLAGMKEAHPDRKEFERVFDKLVEIQNRMREQARVKAKSILRGRLFSDQDKKISTKKIEFVAAAQTVKRLEQELRRAEKKATQINAQMTKGTTTRKRINRIQDSLMRIDERMDQLEVESIALGRINLLEMALKPERASASRRKKSTLMVLLLSAVVGLGYAVLREKLDDRVRTSEDVERVLGQKPSALVWDLRQLKGLGQTSAAETQKRAQEVLVNLYRKLVLKLMRDQSQYGSQIFTGVALNPGQGTTTTLVNILRVCKGRSSEKLYIHLNYFNPITGAHSKAPGLWAVLEGQCNLKQAILRNSKSPYHILPLGSWKQNQKALYQEMGLESIIYALRKDYKTIVIDAPPLSSSADSIYLAQLADCTILVLSAGECRGKDLFHTVKELALNETSALAVVLNKVKPERTINANIATKGQAFLRG